MTRARNEDGRTCKMLRQRRLPVGTNFSHFSVSAQPWLQSGPVTDWLALLD